MLLRNSRKQFLLLTDFQEIRENSVSERERIWKCKMKILISPKFVHHTAPLGTAEQIISVEGKQQPMSALSAYRKQVISRSLSRKKETLIKVFVRDTQEASSLDSTNFFPRLSFLFCSVFFFRVFVRLCLWCRVQSCGFIKKHWSVRFFVEVRFLSIVNIWET